MEGCGLVVNDLLAPQLPRVFHWKVGVVSLGLYASMYTYKWSTHVPREAVQSQVGCVLYNSIWDQLFCA